MQKHFVLPDLGEGIDEAEILRTYVKPNDRVVVDQSLFEVETDKAAVDIPSPYDGTISQLWVRPGKKKVKVGTRLVTIILENVNQLILQEELASARKALVNLRRMVIKEEIPKPGLVDLDFSWLERYLERMRLFAFNVEGKLDRLNINQVAILETCLVAIWVPIERLRWLKRKRRKSKKPYEEVRVYVEQQKTSIKKQTAQGLHVVSLSNEPQIFIASSKESLKFARHVCDELNADDGEKPRLTALVWWNEPELRKLGKFALEAFEMILAKYDYGIFIFGADDKATKRGVRTMATRDNVIFEYGLFVAKFGREQAFVIRDRRTTMLSDLKGLCTTRFDGSLGDAAWERELTTESNTIRKQIRRQWPTRKR